MPLWKKKKAAEPAAPLDVLRWKIVAVNILFAAMVVATLCFVAARQGKNALEEKHRLAFASLCSALEQPILETQTIDHKYNGTPSTIASRPPGARLIREGSPHRESLPAGR